MELRVDGHGNPIVDQFSEEGFVDLVFRILNLKETVGHYQFHMSASYQGSLLGLDVQVVKDIRPGFDQDMKLIKEHVYRQGVSFFRTGKDSDALLSALVELYGLELNVSRMVEVESYTAIALHQEEKQMDSEPIKIKLFGKDDPEGSEDDYHESFFNLDLKNGFVFWNEKDQEYREPLVRALGGLA